MQTLGSDGLVSFENFARVIAVLEKGSPSERLRFCLSLFKDERGMVDASGALAGLRAFTALYGIALDHAELQKFARSIVSGLSEDVCAQLEMAGAIEGIGLNGEAESEVGDFEIV